jgi:hypothetical protein
MASSSQAEDVSLSLTEIERAKNRSEGCVDLRQQRRHQRRQIKLTIWETRARHFLCLSVASERRLANLVTKQWARASMGFAKGHLLAGVARCMPLSRPRSGCGRCTSSCWKYSRWSVRWECVRWNKRPIGVVGKGLGWRIWMDGDVDVDGQRVGEGKATLQIDRRGALVVSALTALPQGEKFCRTRSAYSGLACLSKGDPRHRRSLTSPTTCEQFPEGFSNFTVDNTHSGQYQRDVGAPWPSALGNWPCRADTCHSPRARSQVRPDKLSDASMRREVRNGFRQVTFHGLSTTMG